MRTRRAEILDQPGTDPEVVRRSMGDLTRSNRLFGGAAAVAAEMVVVAPSLPRCATLLDVGTGLGDIALEAQEIAARYAVRLRTIGLDADETLVHAAARRTSHTVRADARQLPFADKSIDVAVCSQLLHHFFDTDVPRVLCELDRVARVRVIIGDVYRSRLAAALFWAASTALGYHPVSRHDGVVSIGRGFTTADLQASIITALGHGAYVRRRPWWRLTASWTPLTAPAHRAVSAA